MRIGKQISILRRAMQPRQRLVVRHQRGRDEVSGVQVGTGNGGDGMRVPIAIVSRAP